MAKLSFLPLRMDNRAASVPVSTPAVCAGLLAFALTASPALAGADATFDQAFTMFEGMLIGSGGKVLALIALAVAIFAMVRGQFGVKEVVLPVGIGIAVTAGVGIVTSTITATI